MLTDEVEIFLWLEIKMGKFSTESETFSKIWGNLKQGRNASLHHGWIDAPGCLLLYPL